MSHMGFVNLPDFWLDVIDILAVVSAASAMQLMDYERCPKLSFVGTRLSQAFRQSCAQDCRLALEDSDKMV